MKKIVIIGAGQIGSRHLQGLANSKLEISIEVVDPFENSRVIAKQRYEEIINNSNIKSIDFYESISQLSDELDVVIVSTGSNVRTKVVNELVKLKKINNLILEKVLFQTIEEYYAMEELLDKNNIKCWVNHFRRVLPFYKKLKEQLSNSKQISYMYQGGNWGLGCNALHFIDNLAYLVGSTNLELTNNFLDKKIYDSKREGFIEFNGLLAGKIDNHVFTLYSNAEYTPGYLTISSDELIVKIDETQGIVKISKKENEWKEEIIEEKILYFQSELSDILIENILNNHICDLPTYKQAMELHIPFIESLLNHMNKINGKDNKLCPIT